MPESSLIFDGHNDTLLNLYLKEGGGGRSFFVKDDRGHLDLSRAREGGFGGGFFAIFVPAKRQEDEPESENKGRRAGSGSPDETEMSVPFDYASDFTQNLVRSLFQLEAESEGQLKVVCNSEELSSCLDKGVIAAVLHFEGAEMIDRNMENLEGYYEQGLRSIGITWSRSNDFGHGVPFLFDHSPDTGPGLTAAGKELVRHCNRLGILVDLSHLNEKGFWDVAELTDAPLVATHSAAHAICASTRNLTDRQIDAIGESGGVLGINFHVGFIRPDGKTNPDTPISDIVRHVAYTATRIGVDYVALGSDFDGATMPVELGDASGLPRLVAELRKVGFDDNELRKITHENWLRVLVQTWKE